MKKVAIQGILGSFHDQAARVLVTGDIDIVPKTTFREVYDAVVDGSVKYGVSAVENSLHGSINAVYRLLETKGLWVCGETYLKIDQCLIGCKDIDLDRLNNLSTRVSSHPVALAQVEQWLDSNLPLATRHEYHDTAASVEMVMEQQDVAHLAVASKLAADTYGAHVVQASINDDPHNYTRFFLLSKDKTEVTGANKTSIILTTGHRVGSLHEALGLFATAGINLSKLDSHPIPGKSWRYAFYIDFDLGAQDPVTQSLLSKLTAQGCTVQVLGSYKSSSLPV